MKKLVTFFVLSFILSSQSFTQTDWFEALSENTVKGYAQPFANAFGLAMNSSSFHSADVPDLFGFSISFKGMYILIPDDQKTYTPTLPAGYASKPTPTIFGDKNGGAYAGPNGYIITPPGINQSSLPVALPQIGLSFMGTELLLRYIPDIPIGDEKLGMFGLGIKHSVSRYIPLIPVDVAVQVLYSNFKITNIIDVSNLAFNAHTSKTFGILTPYFGLQYESSSMDLEYNIDADPNSGDPDIVAGKSVKVSLDSDNNFRAVFGASLNLAFLVLNADVSLGSQTMFGGGLSFEF